MVANVTSSTCVSAPRHHDIIEETWLLVFSLYRVFLCLVREGNQHEFSCQSTLERSSTKCPRRVYWTVDTRTRRRSWRAASASAGETQLPVSCGSSRAGQKATPENMEKGIQTDMYEAPTLLALLKHQFLLVSDSSSCLRGELCEDYRSKWMYTGIEK